jgi:hypothetical protein
VLTGGGDELLTKLVAVHREELRRFREVTVAELLELS